MSNIDNGMKHGMNQDDVNRRSDTQSASFGGMEEQHQDLGGSPGGMRGMASRAGEKIMDTAERQKAVGADYVDGIAESVRRAAGEFDGQVPQAADYIRYAADQMESFSDSFRRRDIPQMMQDVQSFARRQPTALMGLSFLAGFAAVRFLRSGSQGAGASSGSGSWQDRETMGREAMDDGRYGVASPGSDARHGGGSAMNEDRFGTASSSPGMTPGTGL
jgi:hypothetical protein